MKKLIYIACFLCATVVFAQAQNAKITSLIMEPIFPVQNFITLDGNGISSTPIGGEFNPRWESCKPCGVNTEISLSVNRTSNGGLGYIYINGGTNLVIDGTTYNFATGFLEMTYNVPAAKILKTDNRKRSLWYSREGVADIHIKLWRNNNDFPNAQPIFEQTLQMNCKSFLKVSRYRRTENTWQHDTQSYKWVCTAID